MSSRRDTEPRETEHAFQADRDAEVPEVRESVYAAEERLAGGHKWHKGCFKCSMCNKVVHQFETFHFII